MANPIEQKSWFARIALRLRGRRSHTPAPSESSTKEEPQDNKSSCFGLNVIHASEVPQVDIIAVHGLGGHAFRTWTHKETGKMWLRDFLPERLPNARIMSFGYDAKVLNSKSVIGMMENAQNLLADVRSNRTTSEEKERPIVFIGHSLGGLVIKKALIHAQQAECYQPLLSSTKGVMFFGVPHNGADNISLASVAANIARVVVNVSMINLQDLDQNSRPLQEISQSFGHLKGFKIVTVFETNMTVVALGQSIHIVPRSSAALNYGDREVVFSIDGADHHTVCKFSTADDTQFKRVVSYLGWLLEEGAPETKPETPAAQLNAVLGSQGALMPPVQDSQTALPTRERYFEMPYVSSNNFTGRKEYYKQMTETLVLPVKDQCRIAIYGLPGAGKSQLALKYAEDNRANYNAVFYVDASSEEGIVRSYRMLHELLRLEKTIEQDKVEQLKRWFTDSSNPHWLLIFDNANQIHTLNLSKYIPVINGHVIITTQDHRVEDSDLAKKVLHLEMFNLQESLEFLCSRAAVESLTGDEHVAATELAEKMGYHPLALDSTAAWVHHTSSSFRDCTNELPNRREELLKYRPPWASYKKSITDALDLNFRLLERDNPQAASLLIMLSYLDPLNIPRQLLSRAVVSQSRIGSDGEPFEQTPGQGCVNEDLCKLISDRFAFGNAIECILSLSLIYQAKQHSGLLYSGFSFHPLIQSHARSRISDSERAEMIWQAVMLVAQAFPSHFFWERFGNLKSSRVSDFIDHSRIRFILLPHVRACCANLESIADGKVKELISTLSKSNDTVQNHMEWSFLQHAANLFLESYYIEVYSMNNTWASRFISLVDLILQDSRDVHLIVLQLHNKRSLLYKEGNYREAIRLSDEFLRAYFPTVFDQNSQISSSVSTEPRMNAEVGYVLIKHAELLVTEWATKQSFIESQRILTLCRAASPSHPSLAEKVMLSERDRILAKGYKDLGLWELAAGSFRNYCVDCLFPGTPQEGWATADWAQVLIELGRNEEAVQVIEGPLNNRLSKDFVKLSRLATRANDTILLQINLAEARLRQGSYSESKAQFQQCLDRMLAFKHLHHPEKTRVFSIYCGLARISHLTKDWNSARENWEMALDYGLTINSGPDNKPWNREHFYQAVVLYSLSDVHYELGNLDTATSLRREVEASGSILPANRMFWMLGIGTYWFQEISEKMQRRD